MSKPNRKVIHSFGPGELIEIEILLVWDRDKNTFFLMRKAGEDPLGTEYYTEVSEHDDDFPVKWEELLRALGLICKEIRKGETDEH